MRTIYLFMMVTLNGYFEGMDHDISWHNADNIEFQRLVNKHAGHTDAILMGHRTYDLMHAFWPTKEAIQADPDTAHFMSQTPKYVVSHKPFKPGWEQVTVIHKNVFGEIRKLKREDGNDIAIFGSNNLAVSLISENLIDEFRIMVNPVALSRGTPLFHGIGKRYDLKLLKAQPFQSGNVLLHYAPKGLRKRTLIAV